MNSCVSIFRVVLLCIKLMMTYLLKRPQLTVLYGTETGKAKKFAKYLYGVFSETFYASFRSMDDYKFNNNSTGSNNKKTTFVIIVTSTFGNGEAPSNAEVLTLL